MLKHKVDTPAQALAYITDCNLATVCRMAMMKSRPKHEFARQISIAQTAIDWMVGMKVDFTGTRAEEVEAAGSVEKWVEQIQEQRREVSGTEG